MSTMILLIDAFFRAPSNVFKLVRCLRLMQKKDVERIDQLESYFFHPEFRCHIGGKGRISGRYDGWNAYRDKIILGEVGTPGRILNITATKDTVKLLTRLAGERNGRVLDLEVEFLYRFSEGRIIEQRSTPSDDSAWDSFWE